MAVILEQKRSFAGVDLDEANIVPQILMIARRQKPCHVCGQIHEPNKPEKYCQICFASHSGNFSAKRILKKRGNEIKYEVWHYDEQGKPLCHSCYVFRRARKLRIGIYDPKRNLENGRGFIRRLLPKLPL